jgi:hypothetical protein
MPHRGSQHWGAIALAAAVGHRAPSALASSKKTKVIITIVLLAP